MSEYGQVVRLESGDWQAVVLPEAGGVIAALTWRGQDVLRIMVPGAADPRLAACFPMVPYANRVADATFTWRGERVQLARNLPPESASLHGLGWQSAWQLTGRSHFKCALEHRHDGLSDWPFAYQAQQRIRLGPKGCAITLDITNRSSVPMPAGLGLHAYFRRRPGCVLRFCAAAIAETDAGLIPTGRSLPADLLADFTAGSVLPPAPIDHCFLGWDGLATLADDLGTITLEARGTPHLQVHTPADGSALCLEPVSHVPDALNGAPEGMTRLPPGCTASIQMWISAGQQPPAQ